MEKDLKKNNIEKWAENATAVKVLLSPILEQINDTLVDESISIEEKCRWVRFFINSLPASIATYLDNQERT